MSRIHILTGNDNHYTIVVHAPTPTGNNAVGVPWTTALKNSGIAQPSLLPVGTGPGQILQNEANEIVNGAVMEAVFVWVDKPEFTAQEREDSITAEAVRSIQTLQARIANQLRYFGKTVA